MIAESEYTEVLFQSKKDADRAMELTMAATCGETTLLVSTQRMGDFREMMLRHQIPFQEKKSSVTEEDMWPTWPGDQ